MLGKCWCQKGRDVSIDPVELREWMLNYPALIEKSFGGLGSIDEESEIETFLKANTACEWGNSNRCVGEGCFGYQCLTIRPEKSTSPET